MHTACTKLIRTSLVEPILHQSHDGKTCLFITPGQLSRIAEDDITTDIVCLTFEQAIPDYLHTAAMSTIETGESIRVVCARSIRPILWMTLPIALKWKNSLVHGYWSGTLDSVLEEILLNRTYSSVELFGEPRNDIKIEPKDGASRVLFFSPYGSWLVHNQVDAILGTALRIRDAEVLVVRCDGLFGHSCYTLTHSQDKERDCRNCAIIGNEFFSHFPLPTIQLRDYITKGLKETVQEWVNSLHVSHLQNCEYKNYPVGMVVTPHVCSAFRITSRSLGNERVENTYRAMIVNSILTYEACSTIFDLWQPTQLVIFNGAGFAHGAAFNVARSAKIPIVTHERGFSDDTFVIVENAPCVNPEPQIHVAHEWSRVPLVESEFNRIVSFFENREKGKDINFAPFYKFQTDHLRLRSALRIPNDAKIVAVFTSSEYETIYWPSYKKVEQQIEMIDKLIEIFRGRREYLVIRHHPAISGNFGGSPDYDFLTRAYRQSLDLPENVRIIMPNEELTSYALLWNSAACITGISTIGIEATARGVPAAVMDVSPFRLAVACVLERLDKDELETVIDLLLSRKEQEKREDLTKLYRFVNGMYFKYSNKFSSFGVDTSINGPSIRINSVEQLSVGQDEALDRVCDHILVGSSVYNIPEKKELERDQEIENDLITRQFEKVQEYHRRVGEESREKPESCPISVFLPPFSVRNSVLRSSLSVQRVKPVGTFELSGALRSSSDLRAALMKTDSEFVFFPLAQMQYDSSFLSESQDILSQNDSLTGVMWKVWVQDKKEINCSIFGSRPFGESLLILEPHGFTADQAMAFCVFRRSFIMEWASTVTNSTDLITLIHLCLESEHFKKLDIPCGVLHAESLSVTINDFTALDTQFTQEPPKFNDSIFHQWVTSTLQEIEKIVELLNNRNFALAKEKLMYVIPGRPDIPSLYYLLAIADLQLGNVFDAQMSLQRLMKLDPSNQEGGRLLQSIQQGY